MEHGAGMQNVDENEEWEERQLLFADDTALVADLAEKKKKESRDRNWECVRGGS